MKYTKRIGLVVLLLLIITFIYQYPKLNIISGYAAKNMASTVFIANRSAQSVNQHDHQVPMIKLAETELDSQKNAASSSVFGLMKRKAVYREGLGAVLLKSEDDQLNSMPVPKRILSMDTVAFPFGNAAESDTILAGIDYDGLKKVLLAALNDKDQRTRTAMVIYKNQLIGEAYAEGFDRNTPILGWSMTKSVLATLYGILDYQGKIDIQGAAGIKSWEIDDRKNISIDDLLRMQSGLEWDEDYGGISDVTKMLFLESDMGKVQANKEAIAAPAEIWNYSSGTSNLLSLILRKRFEDYQDYLDFPYSQLIDRIGMHSMLIETDLSGTFVGSSYGWASTGDWAKFGLLYLNNGEWNGERVFDSDWVEYVSRPTTKSDGSYGAHFWLNADGKYPDVPRDLFSANGYQGQHVFIIPSKNLVVVRTGLAEAPFFDINDFLRDIMSAIN